MELELKLQSATRAGVTCDGHFSHTFDPHFLLSGNNLALLSTDPNYVLTYGNLLHQALFEPGSLAHQSLGSMQLGSSLLLLAPDDVLQEIPWEYAYDGEYFLVANHHFVRGLPVQERIKGAELGSEVHILAIPAAPIDRNIDSLNVEGEWQRLTEIVEDVSHAVTLERVRPATIERLSDLLAGQNNRIVHFMGHGDLTTEGTVLFFEKENGALESVKAHDFIQHVLGKAFFVTLNACLTATTGPTFFNNLALALVRQQVPYALGMRFPVHDDVARTISRILYSQLARGTSVEEAIFKVRLNLAKSSYSTAIGIPVLYTALTEPLGLKVRDGVYRILDTQYHVDVDVIPLVEWKFYGRIDDLKKLGILLTGDSRPRLITIYAPGGQGKTTLARQAVERFAWAWPGGVYAVRLEAKFEFTAFIFGLAQFLGLDTQNILDPVQVEKVVLERLRGRRTMLVLDGAEGLIEEASRGNPSALALVDFLRGRLSSTRVTLLVTSRERLGWPGESAMDLRGLEPSEGAALFRDNVVMRRSSVEMDLAMDLSRKVDGHPLSLHLLGGAFDKSTMSLTEFVRQYDDQLIRTKDQYKTEDHRQRSLIASIDTSIQYLSSELRKLFSGLWVFHAPFLPEMAQRVFDPVVLNQQGLQTSILDQLQELWKHGLLMREERSFPEGTLSFYRLLPVLRLYAQKNMEQAFKQDELLENFGIAYAQRARLISESHKSDSNIYMGRQMREDFERGLQYTTGACKVRYLIDLALILSREGSEYSHVIQLIEEAVEAAQELNDQQLELTGLRELGMTYQQIGQTQKALTTYKQALDLSEAINDQKAKVFLLRHVGVAYHMSHQYHSALEVLHQALTLSQEIDEINEKVEILNIIAIIARITGEAQQALHHYQEALEALGDSDPHQKTTTLINMAAAYADVGEEDKFWELYNQALGIIKENGFHDFEQFTYQGMANAHLRNGDMNKALEAFRAALAAARSLGDWYTENVILTYMAGVYRDSGQSEQAIEIYQQGIALARKTGSVKMEAGNMNNMAKIYLRLNQREAALEIYQQSLALATAIGDRALEALVIDNMALPLFDLEHKQEAISCKARAINLIEQLQLQALEGKPIEAFRKELEDLHRGTQFDAEFWLGIISTVEDAQMLPMGEMLVSFIKDQMKQKLQNRSTLLFRVDIEALQAAVAILDGDSPILSADNPSYKYLEALRERVSAAHKAISDEQIDIIVNNTIVVMTIFEEQRSEWRAKIADILKSFQEGGTSRQDEVNFFVALLALLDGKTPELPEGNLYSEVFEQIQANI